MEKLINFTVTGMHCSSCETIIKDELQTLGGISEIKIDYKTGKGSLLLDENKNSTEDVIEAIKKAGYSVHVEQSAEIVKKTTKQNDSMRVSFQSHTVTDGHIAEKENGSLGFQGKSENKRLVEFTIPRGKEQESDNYIQRFMKSQHFLHFINGSSVPAEKAGIDKSNTDNKLSEGGTQKKINLSLSGMHCTSCALIIEKALTKVSGVKEAHVNYAAEKASIVFDTPVVTTDILIKTIKKTGYDATVIDGKDSEFESKKRALEIKGLFQKFVVSLILSTPMLYFMLFDFFPWMIGKAFLYPLVGVISLILSTPVQFIIGKGFYKGMWSALLMKTFNMDSLIAIGTSVAYFYSLINFGWYAWVNKSPIGLNGEKIPELYFETAAFLITFVILGKWLEAKAKGQTSAAIKKLMGLQAVTARVIRNGETLDIPLAEVVKNDIIIVRPGEKVPTDGIITKGSSALDESMITGESIPVEKHVDDTVIGGTMNKHGSFEFKATRVGAETMLSQIIKLVEDAQGSKAPIQAFADSISSWFVPAVILIAILTFLIWFFVLGSSLSFALMAFTAVIVIACPCALGLATPTAIMVGTGKGAEYGILVKGGEPLEMADKIKAIIFDKTGTLTKGKPEVTDTVSFNSIEEEDVLRIVASLEKQSEHPLAEAIYKEAQAENVKMSEVTEFKAIPGKGVQGFVEDKIYYFGNRKLIQDVVGISIDKVDRKMKKLEEQGKTVMILSSKKEILGMIGVADTVKETSKEALSMLLQMGITTYMITGDNERTAKAIALQLGITNVFAEVLPEDKAKHVKQLQDTGIRVAMVGDGINDAPALAQADLGIAMGSGTDVAMETGGIVIVKNDLRDVIHSITLSRETMSKIKQNMFFALFYNVIGIPIAARVFFFAGLVLKPELAGLAMAFSSISVVVNSLLLKGYKPGKRNYLSILAPFVMMLVFTAVFIGFAQFSSSPMK